METHEISIKLFGEDYPLTVVCQYFPRLSSTRHYEGQVEGVIVEEATIFSPAVRKDFPFPVAILNHDVYGEVWRQLKEEI